MPRARSQIQIAAGKLISAIQKAWNEQAGEADADESEAIMHRSHELLLAATRDGLLSILGSRSVSQFLGEDWVRAHPNVMTAIAELERAADLSEAASSGEDRCSFCERKLDDVKQLFVGVNGRICDICLRELSSTLENRQ